MMDAQRDRLIEMLNGALKDKFDYVPLSSVIDIADNLIANGVTVRERGEWREVRIVRHNNGKPYTQFAHECSNCKWLNKKKKGWNHKVCPNCGADMR